MAALQPSPYNPMTKKKPVSAAVKAAAERAVARSEGRPIEEPAVPIDPPIVTAAEIGTLGISPVTEDELRKAAEKAKRKYESKKRLLYTPELAAEICTRMLMRDGLGQPRTIKHITETDADMPHEVTIYRWLDLHPDFGKLYARTREAQAHMLAEDIIGIADTEPDNVRARNRMDGRKWYAAKLNRKAYGEKVDTEVSGPDGGPIETRDVTLQEVARKMAFMMRMALEDKQRRQALESSKTIEHAPE